MIPIAYWRNRKLYTRLIGSRCKKCGAEYYPPVKVCKKCGSVEIEEKEMPKTGTIVSFTKLTEPPVDFKDYAPVYLAMIRLDNGILVLGQLADAESEEIKIGAKVMATIRKWTEDGQSGIIYYGYKFKII
ncbi:MAG: Zn-ribbon domain-containing OB-fold protein [Nitrososphaeria archaeon]